MLGIGEFFVIGRTRFTVVETQAHATIDLPSPLAEFTCSAEELRGVRYSDASDRIEVLAKLPSMIRFSPTEEEFQRQGTAVLLAGIPVRRGGGGVDGPAGRATQPKSRSAP